MELYHVLNRGVDKRAIVMDNYDRKRFVTSLYAMNDVNAVLNLGRDMNEIGSQSRELLVHIHGWCLMGNHYHLLVSNEAENGISKFLQKFNIGYTMYFNKRHQRTGVLYQGKTKRILIEREAHFNYILPYIHCNPLDLEKTTRAWRTQSLADSKYALEQIQKYRWSSFRNYAGESEFAEILEGSDLYVNRKALAQETRSYLASLQDPTLAPLTLE